jgi:hypothetical protein
MNLQKQTIIYELFDRDCLSRNYFPYQSWNLQDVKGQLLVIATESQC